MRFPGSKVEIEFVLSIVQVRPFRASTGRCGDRLRHGLGRKQEVPEQQYDRTNSGASQRHLCILSIPAVHYVD